MSNTFICCYFQTGIGKFDDKIFSLISQIIDKQNVICLTFFGNSTEDHYEQELNALKTAVAKAFDSKSPLVTYVVQSLSNSDEMAVEVNYISSIISSTSLIFKTHDDVRYAMWKSRNNSFIMLEGVLGQSFNDSVEMQSCEIFNKIEKILSTENISICNIVRQWNYIGHITDIHQDNQYYQAFNNARAQFYKKTKWEYGYPAATGIGMSCNGIIVSLIAVANGEESQIVPIDNPLQVPAFAYSESLLIGKLSEIKLKATPKFERAKVIFDGVDTICFVSGTAAIRGENSMLEMDAALQTKQTIENILFLISNDNLKLHGVKADANMRISNLRIYIKNAQDFESVKAEIVKVWSMIPAIYLQADVCRKELLVEIEGTAIGIH